MECPINKAEINTTKPTLAMARLYELMWLVVEFVWFLGAKFFLTVSTTYIFLKITGITELKLVPYLLISCILKTV